MEEEVTKATTNQAQTGVTKQDQLLQKVLTAAFAAMLVATPLLPSDTYSLAMEGQIAAPAMLWLMLAICATIAFLLRAWRGTSSKITWTLTDAILGLFFVWVAVAGVVASADANRRAGWNMTASWVTLGVTYYLARLLLRDGTHVRAIVAGILAITLMFSVEGIYEAFVTIPQNQARFRQNPMAVISQAGLDTDLGTVAYEQFRSRLETQGPSATFALENSLAGFLVPAVLLLVGLILSRSQSTNGRSLLLRNLGLATASIALAVCIRYTHSTSAIVAIGVSILIGGVAILFRDHAPLSRAMRYGAFAVLLMIFAWPIVIGFTGGSAASRLPLTLKYRTEYWQSCAAMLAENPLWGCGPGNFQDAYSQFMLPQAAETIADPHNLLWEVICISGALAGLLFLLAIGFAARAPISQWLFGVQFAEDKEASAKDNELSVSLRSLAVGGLAGISLALLLGLSSGSNFLWLFLQSWLFYGILPGVLLIVVLLPWIRHGRLSSSTTWLAWLALAIHLTVSGGIGNPGTGTLFFLLLAIAQTGNSNAGNTSSRTAIPLGIGMLALLSIAGFAHYLWGYVPVLASQSSIGKAEIAVSESNRTAAKEALQAAAEADIWSATPLTKLVVLELQTYLEDAADSRSKPGPLISAVRNAISRTPKSASIRFELAMTLLRANAGSPKEELLSEANSLVAEVNQLAPSKAVAWAYRAYTDAKAGDLENAKKSAKEAIHLDSLNPHEQYDLGREPSPIPGRSFTGWLRELAEAADKP